MSRQFDFFQLTSSTRVRLINPPGNGTERASLLTSLLLPYFRLCGKIVQVDCDELIQYPDVATPATQLRSGIHLDNLNHLFQHWHKVALWSDFVESTDINPEPAIEDLLRSIVENHSTFSLTLLQLIVILTGRTLQAPETRSALILALDTLHAIISSCQRAFSNGNEGSISCPQGLSQQVLEAVKAVDATVLGSIEKTAGEFPTDFYRRTTMPLADIILGTASLDTESFRLFSGEISGAENVSSVDLPLVTRFKYLHETFRACICKGRMELRVFGVNEMSDMLLEIWNVRRQNGGDPILRYAGRVLADGKVVEYIASADSHPQLIIRSNHLFVFPLLTQNWTTSMTENLWSSMVSSPDPRMVSSITRLGVACMKAAPLPVLLDFCHKINALSLDALHSGVLEWLEAIIECLRSDRFPQEEEAGMMPVHMCIRLLRDVLAEPAPTGVDILMVHSRAFNILHHLSKSAMQFERRNAYTDCVGDLSGDTSTAVGSIEAIRAIFFHHTIEDSTILMQELNVSQTLVDNLCSYIVDPRNRDSSDGLILGLQKRLELLVSLFKALPQHGLSDSAEKKLWSHVVGDRMHDGRCRDAAWQILGHFVRSLRTAHKFVDNCIRDYIFTVEAEWFTQPFINFLGPITDYGQQLWSPPSDRPDLVVNPHLTDIIWKVIMDTGDHSVFECATSQLMTLYVNMSSLDNDQFVSVEFLHSQLVERCIQEMIWSSANVAPSAEASGTAEQTPKESQVLPERRFSRCIYVLKAFLCEVRKQPRFRKLRDDARSPTPDSPLVVQDPASLVTIKYQICGLNQDSGIRELYMERESTVEDLKLKLERLTAASEFDTFVAGQRLDLSRNPSAKVETLGGKGAIMVRDSRSRSSLPRSEYQYTSVIEEQIWAHYNDLYAFLDWQPPISTNVFGLLEKLPARAELEGSLLEQGHSQSSTVEFLSTTKPFKSLYHIRTIKLLLIERRRADKVDLERVLRAIEAITKAISHEDVLLLSIEAGSNEDWSLASNVLDLLRRLLKNVPSESGPATIVEPKTFTSNVIRMIQSIPPNPPIHLMQCTHAAYDTILQVSVNNQEVWDSFRNLENVRDIHCWLLLQHPQGRVRLHIVNYICGTIAKASLVSDMTALHNFLPFYWDVATGLLDTDDLDRFPTPELVQLTECVVQYYGDISEDESVLRDCLTKWTNILESYDDKMTKPHESRDSFIYKTARLTQRIVKLLKNLGSSFDATQLVRKIFLKYLFPESSKSMDGGELRLEEKARPSLYSETRRELFDLTVLLCNSNEQFIDLVQKAENYCSDAGHDDISYNLDQSRMLRSPLGYVGLRNLTNTCYMNSLITQLFMNTTFRDFILQAPIANDRDSQKLLAATQELFSHMESSEVKYVDTEHFAFSIVPYDAPSIDISVQMDVDEFYNLLFDRWESQLPTQEAKDRFRSIYGGQMITQIKSMDCEHISERQEPFFAIPLEVKGKIDLADSLRSYVQGDAMEGGTYLRILHFWNAIADSSFIDNRYKCESCGGRFVNAVKRYVSDLLSLIKLAR